MVEKLVMVKAILSLLWPVDRRREKRWAYHRSLQGRSKAAYPQFGVRLRQHTCMGHVEAAEGSQVKPEA